MLPAAERIPVLNEMGIRTIINGAIPISPDGEPIMGLAPELDNFYVACGFTSGIAASGGAGNAMAHWILRRRARASTCGPSTCAASGRTTRSRRYLHERAVEAYGALLRDRTGRSRRRARRAAARRSPLHEILAGKRAVFGSRNSAGSGRTGSRREGIDAADRPSFEGRPNWFDAVGAEHQAVRERVALIDMSSFSKFEIAGRGALAALQRIAANDLDKPPGALDLHAALQRARRHRGRSDHHAARRGPLLLRHRQRLRRARRLGWIAQHLPARRQRRRCAT